jgi:hypothetical protein
MPDLIANSNNLIAITAIFKIFNIVIFALLLRKSLLFCGQNWCRTFSHTLSFMLLPIITYCVTSVIANNLALSLGLVGALSIVRFRNPVKSPFELTIYFLCISVGICSAVSWKWPLLLGFISIALIFFFGIFSIVFQNIYNKKLFDTSFSEGNSLNILEITSTKRIEDLIDSSLLIFFNESKDSNIYRLASIDKEILIKLSKDLSESDEISSLSFSTA